MIERNHHTLQRALSTSKVLRNVDLSLLQKRVAEIQSSAQVSVKLLRVHKPECHRHCITTSLTILIKLQAHENTQEATVCPSFARRQTNNLITLYTQLQMRPVTLTTTCCPSSQVLLKEVGEWRRQEEANNCLRRRFEESRQELERALKKSQSCLRETGDAEELLKKHHVRSNP